MIEDKKDGIKVAGNPEEAFWANAEKRCKDAIETSKREIMINEHLLVLFKQKQKV
jgi:hypothetical protein